MIGSYHHLLHTASGTDDGVIPPPPPYIGTDNGVIPPPPPYSDTDDGVIPPPPYSDTDDGVIPPPPYSDTDDGVIQSPPPYSGIDDGIDDGVIPSNARVLNITAQATLRLKAQANTASLLDFNTIEDKTNSCFTHPGMKIEATFEALCPAHSLYHHCRGGQLQWVEEGKEWGGGREGR